MVRQRNRTGPGRTKPALVRKDSTGSETLQGKDEGEYHSALQKDDLLVAYVEAYVNILSLYAYFLMSF